MDRDHHRGLEISPILIGTLGILAGAIIVATYHMIITSCCQTRRAVDPPRTARISTPNQDMNQERRTSTSPTLIYVKDYNEEICSVCLSEFNEGERIRALPECLHLFHVECIDTWLYSHSNCPLCRTAALAPAQLVLSIPDSGGIQVQQPQEIQPQVILVNER